MNSTFVTKILLLIILFYVILISIDWFAVGNGSSGGAIATILLSLAAGVSEILLVYIHTKKLETLRRGIMIIMASIIGIAIARFGILSSTVGLFSGRTL